MSDYGYDLERPASPDESAPLDLEPYLVSILDLVAVVVTGAVFVTGGAGVGGPLGVLVALAFATFVPGWAILDWLPLGYGVSRLALAVAMSLTICTATAQVLLWVGLWAPVAMLYTLGSLSLFGLLSHLVLDERFFPSWDR
jgi:hypothetical protein